MLLTPSSWHTGKRHGYALSTKQSNLFILSWPLSSLSPAHCTLKGPAKAHPTAQSFSLSNTQLDAGMNVWVPEQWAALEEPGAAQKLVLLCQGELSICLATQSHGSTFAAPLYWLVCVCGLKCGNGAEVMHETETHSLRIHVWEATMY